MTVKNQILGRKPTDESRVTSALNDFAVARARPTLLFFLPREGAIGMPNVVDVSREIADRQFERLDFVIHSQGGDVHAAYQLIRLLRGRARDLTACVPVFARSAATLLCVGADSILLDELASLGPLDAQVYEGSKDGRPNYVSALNPFKALERLRDFSLETLQSAAEMLFDAGIENADEVLKYGMEFVRVTTASLFDKIPSEKLGEYSQALAIGEEYGRRLFRMSAALTEEESQRVLRRLVHEYPSHEYVIDCRELQNLGLPASLFDANMGAAASGLVDAIRRLDEQSEESMIRLVSPAVPEPAGKDGEPERVSETMVGTVKDFGRETTIDEIPVPDEGATRHLGGEELPPRRAGGLQSPRPTNPWRRRRQQQ
jgi:hypothetical protein